MKKLLYVFIVSSLFLGLTTNLSKAGDSLYFFEQRVLKLLGTGADNTWDSSTIWDFVNDGFYEVVTKTGSQAQCILKKDTIAIVIDTWEYSLNNDCYRVMDVFDITDEKALDYIPLGDWKRREVGGKLENISQEGMNLIVGPVPEEATTIIVFYNAYPNRLSADGDTTLIPREFSEAIVLYAVHKCWLRVQDKAWSDYYKGLFKDELKEVISILSAPPYDVIIAPQVIK